MSVCLIHAWPFVDMFKGATGYFGKLRSSPTQNLSQCLNPFQVLVLRATPSRAWANSLSTRFHPEVMKSLNMLLNHSQLLLRFMKPPPSQQRIARHLTLVSNFVFMSYVEADYGDIGRGSQRKANTLLPSPKGSAFSQEPSPSRRSTTDSPSLNAKRLPTTVVSPKWRIFSPFSHPPTPPVIPDPPPPKPHRRRKGDVICLEYTTLDDRGMRQLEGRSDHRPVIGSYAVYM